MGRLIDESLLQEKLALIPMEERTFRRTVEELENAPTVEAIPKADYENRLRADMVAMLTDLQLEIEEHEESIIGHYGKETKESDFPSHKIERNNGRKECVDLIQQKIDNLKEVEQ